MSEPMNPFEPFIDAIAEAVAKKVGPSIGNASGCAELLTPDELAEKLKVPVSWVYEQSGQGKIPTHKIGKYIRFDISEVLASLKKE